MPAETLAFLLLDYGNNGFDKDLVFNIAKESGVAPIDLTQEEKERFMMPMV